MSARRPRRLVAPGPPGPACCRRAVAAADDRLTIYSSRARSVLDPLLQRYMEQTGRRIDVRYGESADLAERIEEEGDDSPADLFVSQSPGALDQLSTKARLAELPAGVLDLVDARFRSEAGEWVGLSGHRRVLLYSTERRHRCRAARHGARPDRPVLRRPGGGRADQRLLPGLRHRDAPVDRRRPDLGVAQGLGGQRRQDLPRQRGHRAGRRSRRRGPRTGEPPRRRAGQGGEPEDGHRRPPARSRRPRQPRPGQRRRPAEVVGPPGRGPPARRLPPRAPRRRPTSPTRPSSTPWPAARRPPRRSRPSTRSGRHPSISARSATSRPRSGSSRPAASPVTDEPATDHRASHARSVSRRTRTVASDGVSRGAAGRGSSARRAGAWPRAGSRASRRGPPRRPGWSRGARGLALSPTSTATAMPSFRRLMEVYSTSRSRRSCSGTVSPTFTGKSRCMLGTPSRNRIRSMSRSACFISSIDSAAGVLGEALVPPVVHHLGVDEVLVDRRQLRREDVVQQLDDARIPLHAGDPIAAGQAAAPSRAATQRSRSRLDRGQASPASRAGAAVVGHLGRRDRAAPDGLLHEVVRDHVAVAQESHRALG